MTLVLSPMEQTDFPRLTEILHAAYYSTSGISALLYNSPPSAESLGKLTETRKRIAREDATARFLKITDTDTGEIIACARWHVYEHERTEEEMDKKAVIADDELIPEFNASVYRALFEPILCRHKDVMGTRPHVYLATLVTHPDHGRKGAGSVLLQWGLDMADEMGLEAFVEATPMGQGLYEKMGFEVAKDVPFDLGQFGEEGVVHHVVGKLVETCINGTDAGAVYGSSAQTRSNRSRDIGTQLVIQSKLVMTSELVGAFDL